MFKSRSILFVFFILFLSIALKAQIKNGFDLSNSEIAINKIKQGGPPKDSIPALYYPNFLSASEVDFLNPNDKVIGITFNGEHKAYPLRILNHHEIVNDSISNIPVVVTYCPLCGSGMVFKAVVDSILLNFGVSGLLYNSDVLMYDKQTQSLWSQLMSRAITGDMSGETLDIFSSDHTTWQDWKTRYPETKVLSTETGFSRNYNKSPYEEYEESANLYFPVEELSDEFSVKEKILGIEVDGKFRAYPYKELKKHGGNRLEDTLNNVDYTIVFDASSKTSRILKSSKPIVSTTLYWFAWYAFHPETEIFKADEK